MGPFGRVLISDALGSDVGSTQSGFAKRSFGGERRASSKMSLWRLWPATKSRSRKPSKLQSFNPQPFSTLSLSTLHPKLYKVETGLSPMNADLKKKKKKQKNKKKTGPPSLRPVLQTRKNTAQYGEGFWALGLGFSPPSLPHDHLGGACPELCDDASQRPALLKAYGVAFKGTGRLRVLTGREPSCEGSWVAISLGIHDAQRRVSLRHRHAGLFLIMHDKCP